MVYIKNGKINNQAVDHDVALLNLIDFKGYWADTDGNKIDATSFDSTVRFYIDKFWNYDIKLKIYISFGDIEEIIEENTISKLIPNYFLEDQCFFEMTLKTKDQYKKLLDGKECELCCNIIDGFNSFHKQDNISKIIIKRSEKIIIDPGHGDHNNRNSQIDPGAISSDKNIYEKDIVLQIAIALQNILCKTFQDVKLTRNSDVENAGTKLQWRIDKAKGMDYFISIHVNASNNPDIEGFSICYKKGDQNSKSLAKKISISNTLFTNRGLDERSDLYVLNKFTGTAVLIEAGFISNTNDLSNMVNHSEKIAYEIADGINNYIK